MSRRKLLKFKEIKILKNVIEHLDYKDGFDFYFWPNFFKNKNDIILEVGCGYGEYTTGQSFKYPKKNFIGVDIKGDRIWKGAKFATENKIENCCFLRAEVLHLLDFFAEGQLSEIWITFPDPRPKKKDEKRRLSSPRFLEIYKKILKKGGLLHIKTDDDDFFDYSLKEIKKLNFSDLEYTFDLYNSELLESHSGIKTRYEKIFTSLGRKVKYLKVRIN